MSHPVQIPCPCPGTPHPDGDTVELREKMGLAAGISVQNLVIDADTADDRIGRAEMIGVLSEAYLLYGIKSWTLVTADGRPIPPTRSAIREQISADFSTWEPVAKAADDLYSKAIILPLVERARNSSRPTPTNGSTSVPSVSTGKRPKRSKRSSTTTTQTVATGTTSSSHVTASN